MLTLALHHLHLSLHARFTHVADREVVAAYGPAPAETHALHHHAGLADLSFRDRLCLVGPDRLRFLNGQITNDLHHKPPGQGCYAALVTPKGRLVSDLHVWILPDELLLDCEPGRAQAVTRRLEAFIIADDVQLVDVSTLYGLLTVQGPAAPQVVNTLTPAPLPPPNHFLSWKSPDGDCYLAHHARLGSIGFDFFAPLPALPNLWTQLAQTTTALGGLPVGWEALETTRIEAGIPRFGADMDESNLPPEAGLESRAISYSKGCYAGQEVIARLRTYGHVNRHLRGLLLQHSTQVLPKPGDKLYQGEREIGHVTSVASSDALKSNIALGYVRREADQPGAILTVRSAAGDQPATLVHLPFPPPPPDVSPPA